MILRQPPALATWVLDRFGYTGRNPALVGDLLEEFGNGRSAAWYWRQTLMVMVAGISRNASASRRYLTACLIGFAAQAAVAVVLRWSEAAFNIHGLAWAILAIVYAGWMKITISGGPAGADLRPLLCTRRCNPQNRRRVMALVALNTFAGYLSSYCICTLFLPPLSLAALACIEVVWLVLFTLSTLLRVPGPIAAKVAKTAG